MQSTSASPKTLWGTVGLLVFALLGAYLLATAGCSPAAGAAGSAPAGKPSAGKDAVLQVIKPDGSSKGASLKDLASLGQGKIFVDGKWEEGPTLPELLRFAGVSEFRRVTIVGSGAPPITLTREQVNPEVVLDFTNHGTVKFSSPAVPKKDWVKDVSTIKVE